MPLETQTKTFLYFIWNYVIHQYKLTHKCSDILWRLDVFREHLWTDDKRDQRKHWWTHKDRKSVFESIHGVQLNLSATFSL